MSIFKKIKAFLVKVGVLEWADNEIDLLWIEVKAKYPVIVTNIKKGIAAVESEELSGGEKAVKVATEVMQTAPLVLLALPDAKAFFVRAVTDVFSSGLDELKDEAGKLLGKL